jgi:DNA-binding MarR family transcriptional regulator
MSDELGLLIGPAYHRFRMLIEAELAVEGLSGRIEMGMGPILFHLEADGELALHELVARTGYTKGTITNQIRRMLGTGLVLRRGDPADARVVRVRLGAAGRAAMPGLHAVRLRVDQRLRQLAGADHDAALRVLRRLAEV